MSTNTMSDNACYARLAVGDISIPTCFNKPMNRMSINLYAYSDTSTIDISLFEYHGLYWYSCRLKRGNVMNSVGFFGLQNCVASLRDTVRGLGFTLDNSDCLTRFVRAWNRQGRKVA